MDGRIARLALAGALGAGLVAAGGLGVGTGEAAGNLTARATRLPTLVVDKELNLSVKSYELSTGTYYRWTIESKAGDEVKIVAPGLFANSWIDQVAIKGIEVHGPATLQGIEFDEDGQASIYLIPIRPGEYPFGVEGRPPAGKLVVK
jgi:hypothetical protein